MLFLTVTTDQEKQFSLHLIFMILFLRQEKFCECNCMGGQNALASWIHMSLTNDTVNAGNTSMLELHSWLTVFLPELIMQTLRK